MYNIETLITQNENSIIEYEEIISSTIYDNCFPTIYGVIYAK